MNAAGSMGAMPAPSPVILAPAADPLTEPQKHSPFKNERSAQPMFS